MFDDRRCARRVLVSVLMLAAACGGDEPGIVANQHPPVTVSLSPLTVGQGASGTLAVQIVGGNPAAPPSLASCASAATAIATATVENGACQVTGVAAGSTTIRATVSTGQSAAANVTVILDALTALSVAPSSALIFATQTATLIPTSTTRAAGITVSYTYVSSNPGVAFVSASGVVSGLSPGVTTITVTATGSGTGSPPRNGRPSSPSPYRSSAWASDRSSLPLFRLDPTRAGQQPATRTSSPCAPSRSAPSGCRRPKSPWGSGGR